ncbi:sodium-dependent transporter [Brachyspira hyodysenteriae]|uniref:sodium-dependent transporter n=1 Tax=Brachyspira hyodysenteriae TaxID=159 RepID=UPI00063DAA51|nr:sodium-dependent transporter [Brachyspira hyodysenteriae]KLI55545.1 sodium-dependent tryptophan transporter [Brachyspira hyodysenteriae]
MNKDRGNFSSSIGFIIACVGSAVGIGNVWMFPWRVGQFGGAIFLILYFLFVIALGVIGLIGEFTLGRMNKTGPIGSFENALKTRNKNFGAIIGIIPMIGSLGIAIGYSVVVGWILRYTVGAIDGSLFSSSDIGIYFVSIITDFGSVPWHITGIVICVIILIGGVSKGIELANMLLIPLFYILFIILLVRVLTLPNIKEGIYYLLFPNWKILYNPKAWAMALGQAFFSISLAGSGMVVYGSYLKDDVNIPKSAIQTAVFSSLGALLCAFVVIPAVFAFGINPNAGPPLIFISIPLVFQKMPFGYFFSILFNISILFAAISSLINLMECPIEALENRLKLSRKVSVITIGIIMIAIGIFIERADRVGSWMDFVSMYIVPTGAMLSAVMIFWVIGMKTFRENAEKGMNKHLPKWFDFMSKYVFVGVSILILILSITLGGF